MSEDQIRMELLEYKKEQRENYQVIIEMIHTIKTETVDAVKKQNEDLIKTNEKILSSYKSVVKWAAMVMLGFFGWLALDHLDTKATMQDLKSDFGTILFIAPKDHSDAIMFDEIKNKYNPKRGDNKRDTTKCSINSSGILKNDEEDKLCT